jgi:uncharacterized protein
MDQKVIQKIIDIIIPIASPEKIFNLGNIEGRHLAFSIFKVLPFEWEQTYALDILILTTGKNRITELQDIIEDRCRSIVPVTAMIMPIEKFNSLFELNHPFPAHVIASKSMIYDAGNIRFSEPGMNEQSELFNQLVEEARCSYRMGCSFLWWSEMQQVRKELRLATFSLHQAAELYFSSIFQAVTGYRMNSHNLDKMYRYCRTFNIELLNFFPRPFDRERHLFNLLQRAYIDARYKANFNIKVSDVQLLTGHIKNLRCIAKKMIKVRKKEQGDVL